MDRNYARSLELVLKHEGGYVDHPKDPGGATNRGITHKVLAEWRGKSMDDVTKDDVKNLSMAETAAIYRARYWKVVKGDDLPSGIDYAVFDFGVNSGPARAAKYLQAVVGVRQDGRIGPNTLAAVRATDAAGVIRTLCDKRMRFLRSLKTFATFGTGWTRRVDDVRAEALRMASQTPASAPEPTPAPTTPDKAPSPDNGLAGAVAALFRILLSLIPKRT